MCTTTSRFVKRVTQILLWCHKHILLQFLVLSSLNLVCINGNDYTRSDSMWQENYHSFLNCSCGQFPLAESFVDGFPVKDADYPWLVGIVPGRGPANKPLCYGTLISDRHILTAASCIRKKNRYEIATYFYGRGISIRRRRSVTNIAIHEGYSPINHDNNLAIVTLALPLQLENVRINRLSPICIPNPYLFSGRLDKIKGIMVKRQDHKTGPKFYFGSVNTKLQPARNASCSNIFSERTTDKLLCHDGNNKPACYGEEGSPLIITVSETQAGQVPVSKGGRYFLLGVYSKGYGCSGFQQGKSGFDVSTNILNHTDWLLRNARDGYFCS